MCAGLAGLYATYHIRLSPDSMHYALASQQIRSGRGVRVPIIPFQGPSADTRGTVPFLIQPPLLPLFLALLGGVAPGKVWPAQVLNIFSHTAIALFSCLIAKRLCGASFGIITGIAVAFALPLLLVSQYLWSEPLFIALVVMCIWCLQMSRYVNREQFPLYGAGLLAAAAIATRFAGVALIPLFLWETIRIWKSRTEKSAIVFRIIAFLVPLCIVAILFVRNYVLSGTIRGFQCPNPQRSIYAAICSVMQGIALQFGIKGFKAQIAILFLIFLVIVILVRSKMDRNIQALKKGLDMIILFMVSYTGVIIVAMVRYQPHLELRFVAPLVPFILITAVFIIELAWRSMTVTRIHKLLLHSGRIIFIILIIVGLLFTLWWKSSFFSPVETVNKRFLSSQTFGWLKTSLPPETIIATNEPFKVAFWGGYPTLRLINRLWNPYHDIPDDMCYQLPRRMSEVGSHYLILFADEDGLDEEHFGEFVSALSRRKRADIDKFRLMYNCSDGVVYHLSK